MDCRDQHQPDEQQIDPVHRSEGSQQCTENPAAHHYCPPPVPCKPSRRPWRARLAGGCRGGVVLLTLGIATAACTTTSSPTGSGVPRVLGQQSGTPEVVGQPAPAGTGQLDAVSCADGPALLGRGIPRGDLCCPGLGPLGLGPVVLGPVVFDHFDLAHLFTDNRRRCNGQRGSDMGGAASGSRPGTGADRDFVPDRPTLYGRRSGRFDVGGHRGHHSRCRSELGSRRHSHRRHGDHQRRVPERRRLHGHRNRRHDVLVGPLD